jgi:hypothetical protein
VTLAATDSFSERNAGMPRDEALRQTRNVLEKARRGGRPSSATVSAPDGEGVQTGVDLAALIEVAAWIESLLGRQLPGQLYRAGLP